MEIKSYTKYNVLLWSICILQAWGCKKKTFTSKKSDHVVKTDISYLRDKYTSPPSYDEATLPSYDQAILPSSQQAIQAIEAAMSRLDQKNKNHHFDFEAVIQKLRESADRKRGITWILTGDNLVRNALSALDVWYTEEDYAIQIINILRAAKKICALYDKDGQEFIKMAEVFMQERQAVQNGGSSTVQVDTRWHAMNKRKVEELTAIVTGKKDDQEKHEQKKKWTKDWAEKEEKYWRDRLTTYNTLVVKTLEQKLPQEHDKSDIAKQLRLAENYVGLDDRHYNITTILQLGDRRFALEDRKWFKLTEKQRKEFEDRAKKDWYKRLNPFEQKLVDAYIDKFLDGDHYMPTQIRNLPGCRNAYQKSIYACDQNNNKEILLGRYYHSGALVPPVTNLADTTFCREFTKDNWDQMVHSAPSLEKVISLNSNNTLPIVGEKYIVKGTSNVVGKNHFMYIPVNLAGVFTKPKFREGVDELLDEVSDFCKKEPNKANDLNNTHYFTRIENLKKAAGCSDVKNMLSQVCNVSDNYYADIASDYITCKTLLDQYKGKKEGSILFGCKSGKDRTGIISYLVDGNIISTTYPELDGHCKPSKLYKTLACASHQQILASLNGGMPGRFGMKYVKKNQTMDNSDEITRLLFPQAALTTADI